MVKDEEPERRPFLFSRRTVLAPDLAVTSRDGPPPILVLIQRTFRGVSPLGRLGPSRGRSRIAHGVELSRV